MIETLPDLIPPIIFTLLLFLFSYLFFGGKRKDILEKGIKPIFKEQCGGKFGLFNLTVPFVRHTLYEEFIIIAFGMKRFILYYSDLTDITTKRGLLSTGVKYSHTRKDLPSSIILWSLSPEKVVETVKRKQKALKK